MNSDRLATEKEMGSSLIFLSFQGVNIKLSLMRKLKHKTWNQKLEEKGIDIFKALIFLNVKPVD